MGLKFIAASLACLGLFSAGLNEVSANPRLLVDVKTGRIIDHQDAFQKWYPASLTKLMTAYTVFRAIRSGRIKLDTPVVMSKASSGQPASKMYLKPGDWMTLDDALKIMLVKSANDVAYAIGENVSGSMPAFVNEMNAEAARIGMRSSHFINPNGLPGKGQYTTARDLGMLAVTIRREFPEYAHYFSLEGFTTGKKQYGNYNLLIGRFNGADGMKTGFICASGFNQISSATRRGRSVISVVLGTDSLAARADMSANMLEKGLSTSGLGSATLQSLQPYGQGREQVADISKEICSKAGKKVRSESRDEVGRHKMTSPYIHENDGQINVELVSIMPAGKGQKGDSPTEDVALASGDIDLVNIPIPLPRPLN